MSSATSSASSREDSFTTTVEWNVRRDATLHLDVFRDARFRMDVVVGQKSLQYGSVKTGAVCQRLHRGIGQQHGKSESRQWHCDSDVDLTYHDPTSDHDGALQRAFLDVVAGNLRQRATYRDIEVVAPPNGVVVLKCVEVIQGLRDPATGVVVSQLPHARIRHPQHNGSAATSAEKRDVLEVLLPIEITVNNHYAVMNSNLLQQYMTCSLAKNLALRVKRWAKSQQLVRDARNGLLSSFAYTLMVVSFLQSLKLLPRLQDPQDENYCGWTCGERWDWATLSDDDFCVRNLDFLVAGWSGIWDAGSRTASLNGSAGIFSWTTSENRCSTKNMRALVLELLEHEKLAGGGTHKVALDGDRTKAMLSLFQLEIEFFRFLQGRIKFARRGTDGPNVLSITKEFAPDLSGLGGCAIAVEDPFICDPTTGTYRVLRCNDTSRYDTVCKAIMKEEQDKTHAFAELLGSLVLPKFTRDRSCAPPMREPPPAPFTAPEKQQFSIGEDVESSSAGHRVRSRSRGRRCSPSRERNKPDLSPCSKPHTADSKCRASPADETDKGTGTAAVNSTNACGATTGSSSDDVMKGAAGAPSTGGAAPESASPNFGLCTASSEKKTARERVFTSSAFDRTDGMAKFEAQAYRDFHPRGAIFFSRKRTQVQQQIDLSCEEVSCDFRQLSSMSDEDDDVHGTPLRISRHSRARAFHFSTRGQLNGLRDAKLEVHVENADRASTRQLSARTKRVQNRDKKRERIARAPSAWDTAIGKRKYFRKPWQQFHPRIDWETSRTFWSDARCRGGEWDQDEDATSDTDTEFEDEVPVKNCINRDVCEWNGPNRSRAKEKFYKSFGWGRLSRGSDVEEEPDDKYLTGCFVGENRAVRVLSVRAEKASRPRPLEETRLVEHFSRFGVVRGVFISRDEEFNFKPKRHGEWCAGAAWVVFESEDAACDAASECNGTRALLGSGQCNINSLSNLHKIRVTLLLNAVPVCVPRRLEEYRFSGRIIMIRNWDWLDKKRDYESQGTEASLRQIFSQGEEPFPVTLAVSYPTSKRAWVVFESSHDAYAAASKILWGWEDEDEWLHVRLLKCWSRPTQKLIQNEYESGDKDFDDHDASDVSSPTSLELV